MLNKHDQWAVDEERKFPSLSEPSTAEREGEELRQSIGQIQQTADQFQKEVAQDRLLDPAAIQRLSGKMEFIQSEVAAIEEAFLSGRVSLRQVSHRLRNHADWSGVDREHVEREFRDLIEDSFRREIARKASYPSPLGLFLCVTDAAWRLRQELQQNQNPMLRSDGQVIIAELEQHALSHNSFLTQNLELLRSLPHAMLEAAARVSLEEQQAVVEACALGEAAKQRMAVLVEDPGAHEIIAFYQEQNRPLEHYQPTDYAVVQRINQRFPLDIRKIYEGQFGDKKTLKDLESFHTFYVLAELNERHPAVPLKNLSPMDIQWLGLCMKVQGEKEVERVWHSPSVETFIRERHKTPPEKIGQFAYTLTSVEQAFIPEEPKHDHSSWWMDREESQKWARDNQGLNGAVKRLQAYYVTLEKIGPFRARWLAFMEPAPLKEEDVSEVSEQEVLALEGYAALVGFKRKLPIHEFYALREYFSDPTWSEVKAGLSHLVEAGVVKHVAPTREWFETARLAARSAYAPVNRFLAQCVRRGGSYVRRCTGYADEKPVVEERDDRSIKALYECRRLCLTYLQEDTDQIVDFVANRGTYRIMGYEREMIHRMVDNSLFEIKEDPLDLPLMEGFIVSANQRLRYLANQPTNPDERTPVQEFLQLTPEERTRCLFLREHLQIMESGEEFALAKSPEGKELEGLIRKGFDRYSLPILREMALRPDCHGLFFYLHPNHSDDQAREKMARLIALKEAGLPEIFFLIKPSQATYLINEGYTPYEEWLEAWPPERLVRLGKVVAAVATQPYTLRDLLALDQEAADEKLEYYIKTSVTYGSEKLCGYVSLRETLSEEQLRRLQERIRHAEQTMGVGLNEWNRKHLGELNSDTWEYIRTDGALLARCLQNNILEGIERVPKSFLAEEAVWDYGLVWALIDVGPDVQQKWMDALHFCLARGLTLTRQTNWAKLAEYIETSPWIFSEACTARGESKLEILMEFGKLGVSEQEMEHSFLSEFLFTSCYEVREAVQALRDRSWLPLLPPQEEALARYVGTPLRWELYEQVRTTVQSGKDFDELIRLCEAGDGHRNDLSVVSYHLQDDWDKARKTSIKRRLIEKSPVFGKISFEDGFTRRPGLSMARALESMLDLPEPVVPRFEAVVALHEYLTSSIKPEDFSSLLLLLQHPNFDMVLRCAQLHPDGLVPILRLPAAEVQAWCDRLSEEDVKRYQALPKEIRLPLREVPAFFACGKSEAVVQLYHALKDIFGESFKPSIYDLLFLDAEHDLAELRALQARCAYPLTMDRLKALIEVTDGEQQRVLQKVLSVGQAETRLDPELILSSLEQMPAELRAGAVRAKGIQTFGWPIVKYREELKRDCGVTDKEMDRLIVTLYERRDWIRDSERLPQTIDFAVAQVILLGVQSDKREEAMKDVLRCYVDEPGPMLELLCGPLKEELGRTCIRNWKSLPAWMKVEKLFWTTIFEGEPEILFVHLDEIPPGIVFEKAQWDRAVDGFIRRYSQLPDLNPDQAPEADKARVAMQRERLRAHLIEVAEGWKEQPEQFMETWERVVDSAHADVKHLSIVFELMAFLKASSLPNKESLIPRAEKLVVQSLVHIDPTIERTFKDPAKLGRLHEFVVQQIVQFIRTKSEEQSADVTTDIVEAVRRKLQEIKRAFESSDAAESQRRMVFLDMYDLRQCNDPSVGSLRADTQAMQQRVEQDVREILLVSGSQRELKYVRKQGKRFLPEQRERFERLVEQAPKIRREADRRNRTQADRLPPGALAHGVDSMHLAVILDGGSFSGELIGPKSTADQSGLLGLDTCQVAGGRAEATFETRFQALSNRGYGDIVLVFGDYANSPYQADRPIYHSGVIGGDHKLVRCGIPSTEITGIIVRAGRSAEMVKKDVATHGIYIPVMNEQGEVIFSEQEFDRMKLVYNALSQRGYPRPIADAVFSYIDQGPFATHRHEVVVRKALDAMAAVWPEAREDLAVLVSFLRGNDLNARDDAWYEEASFADIMNVIRGGADRKVGAKARGALWNEPHNTPQALGAAVADAKALEHERARRPNVFLDNFFGKQLDFAGLRGRRQEFERGVVDILFHRGWADAARTTDIASRFTEQKKLLMRALWDRVWAELLPPIEGEPDEQRQTWEIYRERITPVLTGSAGRNEMVLGSDLDYLLVIDDQIVPLEDEEGLKNFVNNVLAQKMNQILQEQGIKGDAGLAKADRAPYTKLSQLRTFKIDLQKSRQDEEPTNIVDAEALMENEQDREVVRQAKRALLQENPSASLLDAYILRELEISSGGYPSYVERFEELYASFASGDVLNKIKESLQRVITFKIYHLLFEGVNTGKIPSSEISGIPAATPEKIRLLEQYEILSHHEARLSLELLGFAYRLRFAGEIYSREADEADTKKVSNVRFRVDDLSYREREHLFGLLKGFKAEVLYK